MSAEIKDTDYRGNAVTRTAEQFAVTLAENEGGVAERAEGTAHNVARAFGRLLDLLVDQKRITSEEALQVIRGY